MEPTTNTIEYSIEELNIDADQLNLDSDSYWESRGEEERPDYWGDRIED